MALINEMQQEKTLSDFQGKALGGFATSTFAPLACRTEAAVEGSKSSLLEVKRPQDRGNSQHQLSDMRMRPSWMFQLSGPTSSRKNEPR